MVSIRTGLHSVYFNCDFFLLWPLLKWKIPLMSSKDYTYHWRKTYGKYKQVKKISTILISKKIKDSFL